MVYEHFTVMEVRMKEGILTEVVNFKSRKMVLMSKAALEICNWA